jgi:hypothetical protein
MAKLSLPAARIYDKITRFVNTEQQNIRLYLQNNQESLLNQKNL